MVRNPDRQVGIKQAFTDRLYEVQWSDFAHGRLPRTSDEEAHPQQQEYNLLEGRLRVRPEF
jgi:hypothetical protein